MIHLRFNDRVITPKGTGLVIGAVDIEDGEPVSYMVQYGRADFPREKWLDMAPKCGPTVTMVVPARECVKIAEVKK